MKLNKTAILFAAFYLCLPYGLSSIASNDKGQAVLKTVESIQHTYDSIRSLRADFMQMTFSAGSPEGIRASGRVWFMPPESMRWEYDLPEKQLIVTSGENVYIYEKEAAQVTILSREHFLSTDISKAFFFGKGDIKRLFKIRQGMSNGRPDPLKFVLIPKENNPQIKRIVVTAGRKLNVVRELWFEDHFGGRTRLLFSDIKLNGDINRDMFSFKIPEGVDVYRAD